MTKLNTLFFSFVTALALITFAGTAVALVKIHQGHTPVATQTEGVILGHRIGSDGQLHLVMAK